LRMKIYDFGCGNHKWPDAIGIDLDPSADIVANIENLKEVVEDGSADMVVISHAIEHANSLSILSEAYRVLNRGGLVCVETPNAYNASIVLRLLFRGQYYVSPDHVQTFGLRELSNAMRKTGFRVISFGYKQYEDRFRDEAKLGITNKLGRFLAKFLPQFSEVITMTGEKP